MARGRSRRTRGRGGGSRVSQVADQQFAYLVPGGTTTWTRSSFQLLAGMGDRPFRVRSVRVTYESAQPSLLQCRLYTPGGTDNVVSTGVLVSGTSARTRTLRLGQSASLWFPGNSSQSSVLVAIDCLKLTSSGAASSGPVVACLDVHFELAPQELTGH
jgi:hypothetical protein